MSVISFEPLIQESNIPYKEQTPQAAPQKFSFGSSTLFIEDIRRKVLDDTRKEPLTEEERKYLIVLNTNTYIPLTGQEKNPYAVLRRTRSLTKNEKEYFTRLGIEKYEPLSIKERELLILVHQSNQIDGPSLVEAKRCLTKICGQRFLSKEEKKYLSDLGIPKKVPLTEKEREELTCLRNRQTNITVREKSKLLCLRKSKSLTEEEKKCFAQLNVVNKEPLSKEEKQSLIKLNATKSMLGKEEKDCLTHFLENKSLTEDERKYLTQLHILRRNSFTEREQTYLTALFSSIAKKDPTFSILNAGVLEGFRTDEQKAAFKRVFKEHYDTALIYALGLNDDN